MLVETIMPTGVTREVTKRTGDPYARRIRKVCRRCNSGWMSRLQAAAKPVLIPLLEGKETVLDERAQNHLACWIAMFTIISEHDPRTFIAIHQNDRNFLRTRLRVPEHWRIHIGYYPGEVEQHNSIHIPLKLVDENVMDRDQVATVLHNTQATSFFLGKLFVNVMASSLPLAQRLIGVLRWPPQIETKFPRVWPVVNASLGWPPPEGLTAIEAAFITDGLPEWLKHVANVIN